MGDIVRIEEAREERERELREERECIASTLELLAAKVRAGDVIGVCVAAVPSDRQSVTVMVRKVSECGTHELVGAATILANVLADVSSRP